MSMSSTPKKYFRILGVSPSVWGFGFVLLEGNNSLVDWDAKGTKKNKNDQCVREVEKLIRQYEPDAVVLFDHAVDLHRSLRIRKLNQRIIALVKKHKIKLALFSKGQVKQVLLPNGGTNHDIAKGVADRFPDELAFRLPPK